MEKQAQKRFVDLGKLNPEQKDAVTFGEGPLLIVAGAGTGKTTVITDRFCYLIQEKLARPEEILALTFTEKAAQEMEERIDIMLPFGYVDLWVSTFHSFADSILREYGLDIGLATDFKLVDETQAWILVRQNLDLFKMHYYRPLGNPTKFISALLSHFSRCKDEGIYPQDYCAYAEGLRGSVDDIPVGGTQEISESQRLKEISDAYATYQKLLLDNGLLDFGDLINYCLKLFKERPVILDKIRKRFKYILVDEFQDTNFAQYELVKMIAAPQNNLTVCGDDDQSIFRFRGASFSNVLNFKNDFPQATEVVLTKNYRSAQPILDKAYSFIQLNNPNRLEFQLNQIEEIARRAKLKGVAIEDFKKIDKRLLSQTGKAGEIKYNQYESAEDEIDGIIKHIGKILGEDKDASFGDIAILTRTNDTAGIFCRALERRNLPYDYVASSGLYNKAIILDSVAYLKLLDNYHESSAMYRILNLPFLKIAYDDIITISRESKRNGWSIFEGLNKVAFIKGITQESRKSIEDLLALIKKHSLNVSTSKPSELFYAFIKESGYLEYLAHQENENPQKVKEDVSLINQFLKKMKAFEESQFDPTLKGFMLQVSMEIDSGSSGRLAREYEEGPDAIKVMTVHSAKGLEFKYVFLPYLTDKKFPTIERKDPIEVPEDLIKEIVPDGDTHLQEERRLFYVALTRAKEGLFLSSSKDYGGVQKRRPSAFLVEAGFVLPEPSKKRERKKASVAQITEEQPIATISQRVGGARPAFDHFSFTQFQAFRNCPLQYKFAHIIKIPIEPRASLSFGKIMHETLEQFIRESAQDGFVTQQSLLGAPIKKENALTVERLLSIFKSQWKDEGFTNAKEKEEYFKQGEKSLRIFYKNFQNEHPKVAIFNNKPALEVKFKLKIADITIVGKIDRIDDVEGGVELIDYKTGKPKEKLDRDDKVQLLLYQAAARQAIDKIPVKLTYYYLENGSRLSFIGSEKDIQKEKEEFAQYAKDIQQSNFKPTPGWQCKTCDFNSICEFKDKNL